MSLQKQIENDFVEAMKNKTETALSVLRMLRASLANKKIENKLAKDDSLSDEEIIAVLKTEIKKRKDSIQSYMDADRDDLVKKEKDELVILEKYLPEQLSEEDIRKELQSIVEEVGASGVSDFGRVMGRAMKAFQGQAEGETVSKLVKEILAK